MLTSRLAAALQPICHTFVQCTSQSSPQRTQALRPSATPGGSTPGRTPSMRTRPLPPGRSRAAPRGGVQSEPSSPRGAGSGSLLGADALADPLLDELLPPGEDAFTASPAASDNIKVRYNRMG